MKIAVFGGTFDPPHAGHSEACSIVSGMLKPDLFLIIPNYRPHYKTIPSDSPSEYERFLLCRKAFGHVENAEVVSPDCDYAEIRFTADLIRRLREDYKDCDIYLVIGSDQYYSIEKWFDFSYIIKSCCLVVFSRRDDFQKLTAFNNEFSDKYKVNTIIPDIKTPDCGSFQIRNSLLSSDKPGFLSDSIYSEIIRNRFYSAKPDIEWLLSEVLKFMPHRREKHVRGCIQTASRLAVLYGCDTAKAEEAAALHDITKGFNRSEHLQLLKNTEFGQTSELFGFPEILHAFSGAELSRKIFGSEEEVCNAVRWHTTGRPAMTVLEEIVFLSDIIEPSRSFTGVDELRKLASADLDKAVAAALKFSLDHIKNKGEAPYRASADAYEWYRKTGD